MGKFKNRDLLLNDAGYRMKYAKLVCQALNKHLPDDKKIKDADIVKKVFSDASKKFEKADKFKDKLEEIKEINSKTHVEPGPIREAEYFMGTEEEINNFRKSISTAKGAKEYVYNNVVKAMEMDPTKVMVKDEEEMAKRYMENPLKYQQLNCSSSCLQNQKLSFGEKLDKIYDKQKSMIEGIGNGFQHAFEKQSNPLNMLIPDLPQINGQCIIEAMNDIMEIGKDENAPECLSNPQNSIYYSQHIDVVKENQIMYAELNKLKKDENNKLPDDIVSSKFIVEGKETSYFNYVQATKAGKDRSIEKRSDEEIKEIKDELYSGKALSYISQSKEKAAEAGEIRPLDKLEKAGNMNTICHSIEEFSNAINKTNSVFSKDTDEFKKMRDLANDFKKEYQNANLELSNPDKIIEFYNKNKANIEAIKKATDDYCKMKDAKNKAEIASGKKLSSRSENRFKEATNFQNLMNKLNTKDNLEYEVLPVEPYKDLEKTKVKEEVKKEEKVEEKVIEEPKPKSYTLAESKNVFKEYLTNKGIYTEKEVIDKTNLVRTELRRLSTDPTTRDKQLKDIENLSTKRTEMMNRLKEKIPSLKHSKDDKPIYEFFSKMGDNLYAIKNGKDDDITKGAIKLNVDAVEIMIKTSNPNVSNEMLGRETDKVMMIIKNVALTTLTNENQDKDLEYSNIIKSATKEINVNTIRKEVKNMGSEVNEIINKIENIKDQKEDVNLESNFVEKTDNVVKIEKEDKQLVMVDELEL